MCTCVVIVVFATGYVRTAEHKSKNLKIPLIVSQLLGQLVTISVTHCQNIVLDPLLCSSYKVRIRTRRLSKRKRKKNDNLLQHFL